jgi:hypothetical protein
MTVYSGWLTGSSGTWEFQKQHDQKATSTMLLPTDHAQHHQHPSQKIQIIKKTLKTELHPNSMKKDDNCP